MTSTSFRGRASISGLPLAVPTTGFPRSFHKAIPSVICVRKQSVTRPIIHQIFLPSSNFVTKAATSSSADTTLVRLLESEIVCAELPAHENNFPESFPFEIHDAPGERIVTLSRRFQDEIIKVDVYMPKDAPDAEDEEEDDEYEDEDEDEEKEEDEEDEEDDEDEDAYIEEWSRSILPLVVKIIKGDGEYLEFYITAYDDEIVIDNLSVKSPGSDKDEQGPDFNSLDDNLRKALYEYLNVRGINLGIPNILFEYMSKKDSSEYLVWLQKLKNFVEK